MTGRQTFITLMELAKAAEQGDLEKVKSVAQDEQEVFRFGELAMRRAALNGHIDVMEYLFDKHFVSLIGATGFEYRDVMANAPDEAKAWYEDHVGTYVCTDIEWQELVENGKVTADALLAPYEPGGEQHLLLTAAAACEFPAAIDILIAAGRVQELTADHFQYRDYNTTLVGYLVAFGGLQDAFRPEIWSGRPAEMEKAWRQIPPAVQPEIDLTGLFEADRHRAILKKIRATKWPRLKGTGRDKKAIRRRRSGK